MGYALHLEMICVGAAKNGNGNHIKGLRRACQGVGRNVYCLRSNGLAGEEFGFDWNHTGFSLTLTWAWRALPSAGKGGEANAGRFCFQSPVSSPRDPRPNQCFHQHVNNDANLCIENLSILVRHIKTLY